MSKDYARKRLARIRCVFDCVQSIRDGKELPDALCFVPADVELKLQSENSSASLSIRESPSLSAPKIGEIPHKVGTKITVSGEDYWNDEGRWLNVASATLKKFASGKCDVCGWLFVNSRDRKVKDAVDIAKVKPKKKSKKVVVGNWESAVELYYSLNISRSEALEEQADVQAMRKLKTPPQNWSLEADEELTRFINQNNTFQKETALGNVSQYVESIEVSSESGSLATLTDGDTETFWESDGSQGRHWIRLKMKQGTIVKRLFINVDSSDDNYMPSRVQVYGGEVGDVKQLNEVSLDTTNTVGDVLILEDMTQHCAIIEIWIKECKDDGIDTRIHGLKIVSSEEKEPGLSADIFKNRSSIVRFPKLEHVGDDMLYNRAKSLLRFVTLLDSVLHFILPTWKFTAGSYSNLEIIRQLLPLSRRRLTLIDRFLKESQSCITVSRMPKVVINRHTAAEHRGNPSKDPEGRSSIFHQLYEALKSDKCGVTLDFRWSNRYDQWWECKFISEGIIDQGGGFRDSLCDIAEELCPSLEDSLLPLPFFIRSPNQLQDSSNVYRDGYIPNPSCYLFAQYEWLGMLMGGHLRGNECLLLSFPKFVWRQLLGEKVSWLHDFITVDAASVKLVGSLGQMDKKKFEEKFAGALTYTAVLSNGTILQLTPNGEDQLVSYEDRLHYAELLQNARMNESHMQIKAIHRGLRKVVPASLMDLLTWQELEIKICGNPNVNVEDLRKSTYCEDLSETDDRVKYFWKSMENFTNDDRSRFLRFVTGRRRLPVHMTLSAGKSSAPVDSLPEAATCSSTLFLPSYSSCKVAEEKLRYAAYNCVAIDTDSQPWDE